jgi:hypothetical protein
MYICDNSLSTHPSLSESKEKEGVVSHNASLWPLSMRINCKNTYMLAPEWCYSQWREMMHVGVENTFENDDYGMGLQGVCRHQH